MGCNETKDNSLPVLLCFFETKNEEQKSYCLRLKDNFQHPRSIRFEIKSTPQVPFSIRFRIKENTQEIQNVFNNSDEVMNETLQKMYNLLNNNN